ncbi:ABC transporter ATP-binding protein [Spirochaeta thermophila]|uniref:Putative ATP-binding ABC transporter protein n=1 Tax=Winmispira thermophila (strain ATCC 49972 / DSM 6192 / RI 19.B1) TaxID=665571 RepID=E0RP83_WINT6|nr:ABC transporter ATP-binding protein [Spirochaeta thermophila]ADN01277.1 putative ATP-binding ABC transporter protein [Spirochaeta thermophila DSM 6192]
MVVIEVRDVVKRYGEREALAGVSLMVQEGEVCGIVGPNGAGKTTLLECMEGLRRPERGLIRVWGVVPWSREGRGVRSTIGCQLQDDALPRGMKVREAVRLFAAIYGSEDRAWWEEVLSVCGLGGREDARWEELSGGLRQRLLLALALLHRPRLVFLDELTSGLDPHGRREVWHLIRRVKEMGTTVVLTTHYMEEAEVLCDRVVLLHQGRVVAMGSPGELVEAYGGGYVIAPEGEVGDVVKGMGMDGVEWRDGVVVCRGGKEQVVEVVRRLVHAEGIGGLSIRRPSLEDVFLSLTGRYEDERGV